MEKRKRVYKVLFISVLGISTLLGILVLLTITLYPSLAKYVDWVAPLPSFFCIIFMLWGKEVIIPFSLWGILHPVIKLAWWGGLIFNMYLMVSSIFDLL